MKGRQLKQRFMEHSRRHNNYYNYPQAEAKTCSRTISIDNLTIPTRTITQTIELKDDNERDLTCHKRIGLYRDVVTAGNCGTLLPFLSSLRVREKRSHTQPITSEPQPFAVYDKKPCLQKEKQSVCDFRAPNKCAQFYEIWQHRADRSVKDTIDFEVSLRHYQGSRAVRRKDFSYLNTRLKQQYPSPIFEPGQVKCPKLAGLIKTSQLKIRR